MIKTDEGDQICPVNRRRKTSIPPSFRHEGGRNPALKLDSRQNRSGMTNLMHLFPGQLWSAIEPVCYTERPWGGLF
jgi:hypothetical protein